MVRKLTAALLGVGVLVPGLANALGLGEIKLNSHLSEPLNAEIELVQVRELTEAEILPGLASQDEFDAAGLERFHHLTDMKFEVVVNSSGRSYIKVKTRKPIREPFVNFLVEVHWPAGRLLREYTLLLDPPNFSLTAPQTVQPAVTVSAPKQEPAPASQPTTQAAVSAPTTPPVTAPAQPTPQSGAGKTYGPTQSSDSLWSIARTLRPSQDVSMQQTMIAIQQLNPEAFIDGNINLMRKGQILRGPTAEEARQISSREAIDLVQRQNRAWQERVSGGRSAADTETAQIDTSGRAVDSFEETVRSDEGRLRLVSADITESGSDSGQGGVVSGDDGTLRKRAELAEETADKYRLENEDLQGKVGELEEQVNTGEKLLDLKDDQIAALQARLAKLEEEIKRVQAAQGAAGVPEPDMMAPETEEAMVAEPETMAEEPQPMEPEAEPEIAEATTGEGVDYNFEEEATPEAAVEAPTPKPPEQQPAITVEETPKKVVVEPPAEKTPQVPQEPPSLVEQITKNPLYMAIGGGAILILVLLAVIISRKRGEKSEDELDEAMVEDFSLNVEDEAAELEAPEEEAAEVEPGEETIPQTSDVLGEADIYIAYGRFPQAIEMLEKAADVEPHRGDIRLKLLETSIEAKDENTFMKHYDALQGMDVPEDVSRANALKEQFLGGGGDETSADFGDAAEEGEDTLVMDRGFGEAAPEQLQEPEQFEEANELDFNLDEDDTAIQPPPEQAFEEPEQELEESTELDFNLDFDSATEPETAEADTGLDFTADTAEKEEASDEFSLDFDVESDTEGLIEPETEAKAEADETSLDFDTEFSLDLDEEVDEEKPQLVEDDDDTVVSFGEAEESLDFELAEDTEAEADESLEFNLDLDSAEAEIENDVDDLTLDEGEDTLVAPGADLVEPDEEPQAEAKPAEGVIGSDEAAKLADELDLDLDLEISGDESLEAESSADDLEFSVETEDEPSEELEQQPEQELPEQDFAQPETDEAEEAGLTEAEIPEDFEAPQIESEAAAETMIAPPSDAAANSEEELDFLTDADETSTKLDLARAYIDMGDREGAKDILDEVLIEGTDEQQGEAKQLLARLD